ncbi:MAG: DUF3050 domain-containing protein [Marinoscillum sp.]
MDNIVKNIKKYSPKETDALLQTVNNVVQHPVFKKLNSLDNVIKYSEFQIWCVWDFMSILKCAQNFIFNNDILWSPPSNPNAGSAFYKLIESEETDLGFRNDKLNRASHFQSFILAMNQMGADTSGINNFLKFIQSGNSLEEALNKSSASEKTQEFLITNNQLINKSPLNALALMTLTRENIIPSVFNSLMNNIQKSDKIEKFIWYHERHIHLDMVLHGKLSFFIFNEFFNATDLIKESIEASILSLNARIQLLNEINNKLK